MPDTGVLFAINVAGTTVGLVFGSLIVTFIAHVMGWDE